MNKEAILCPGKEHEKYQKVLLFKSKSEIFVNCKVHGWVGVQFMSNGKPINLENVGIVVRPSEQSVIRNDIAPTLSIGEFKKK